MIKEEYINITKTLTKINLLSTRSSLKKQEDKNIMFITKFPPVIGGVASQDYWYAVSLAKNGYNVLVVTNCLEDDNDYCVDRNYTELFYNCNKKIGKGSIATFYTSTSKDLNKKTKKNHNHIPYNNMSTTKLYAIAKKIILEYNPKIIYSGYLEPYGFIGYLLSKEFSIPHLVAFAGSDFSRLSTVGELNSTFNDIFSNANTIMTTWDKMDRLIALSARPSSISITPKPVILPEDYFLNKKKEHGRVVGLYGKYGEHKRTEVIFEAISKCPDVILKCMLNNRKQKYLLNCFEKYNLHNVALCSSEYPWRMYDFFENIDIMFFFDEDFDVSIHAPIAPIEAALCGVCIVLSKSLFNKMQIYGLEPGYNCVVIDEVSVKKTVDVLEDFLKKPEYYYNIGNNGSESLSNSVNRFLFENIKKGELSIKNNTYIDFLIAIYSFFKYTISIAGESEILSLANSLYNSKIPILQNLYNICGKIKMLKFYNFLTTTHKEIIDLEVLKVEMFFEEQDNNKQFYVNFSTDIRLSKTAVKTRKNVVIKKIEAQTDAIKMFFNREVEFLVKQLISPQTIYLVCYPNFEIRVEKNERYAEFILNFKSGCKLNDEEKLLFEKGIAEGYLIGGY